LYDGSALSVLEDLESGRLEFHHCPDSAVPRIALIAGAPFTFRLDDRNGLMPSVDEFLQPLELATAATKLAPKPHFAVFITHSAMLHQKTIGRFSAAVFQLLERNYAVHLSLTTLQHHGLPQAKDILVMIAAPPATSIRWEPHWPLTYSQPSHKVKDLIGDIAFANPRAFTGTKCGFVCSLPGCDDSNGATSPDDARLLYNHQTGRICKTAKASVGMDADTVKLTPYGATPLLHPSKPICSDS
jgi:hypothetical protein